MVEGLRNCPPLPVCNDIGDRVFALVDGIAINALMDPKRWTRKRQEGTPMGVAVWFDWDGKVVRMFGGFRV